MGNGMKIALVIGLFVVVAAIVKLIDDDAQEPTDDPTTQLSSETSSARDGTTGRAGRSEASDPPERWTPKTDDPPASREERADPNPAGTDPSSEGLRPAGAEDVGGVANASYPSNGTSGSDVLAQLYREAGFDPDSVLEPSPGDGDGASDPDDLGGPPLETGADLDPTPVTPPPASVAEREAARTPVDPRAESSPTETSRSAATPPRSREEAVAPSASGFPRKYTLVEGDTVWDLSKAMYGSHEFVKEILAANPSLGDGSSVRAGIEITLPAITRAPAPRKDPEPTLATGQRSHTVAKGDNLYRLAERYLGKGTRWPDIVAANPGIDPDHLPVGEPIVIPPK